MRARRLLVAATLLAAQSVLGVEISGRVVGVADGDTVTLLDPANVQHKARLAGIDAPESAQAFGARSRENLSRLVFGKAVRADCQKRDRYGRQVCRIWAAPEDCPRCGQTLDVALAQVTVGLAWHYKDYEKEQTLEERERYSFAEDEARARRAGLWGDRQPVPPWEWRNRRRQDRAR